MTPLPDFRLEAYLSRWEFTARYHLTASDMQTMSVSELLTLADDHDRRVWDGLSLGYTETFGDPDLRRAISQMYSSVDEDDVLCFAGAQEGIYLAMQVLLGANDHAVVVTPNYQSAETVPLSLCEVTGVALDPEQNWSLDLDQVAKKIRPNTRVISVNFPNNPTGKILGADEFTQLVQLCDERGIYLFSDEVYRGLERDASRTLPQAADLYPNALSLNVVSKSLGLPGLRIGWIACRDRELRARLERAKHYTTICNSAPSEILARIAIKARERILERNRSIIATNVIAFAGLAGCAEEDRSALAAAEQETTTRATQEGRPDVTADDWVITFAFDVDPSMELMDLWEGKLERRDGAVSRVPGRGVDVTVYAPGDLAMFDAAEKMAVEVVDTVQVEPTGVDIVREQEHRRRADAYTMPELMSAAEIAVELGVARQRVHQLRSTAAFPAPLAELRGGAVWDAAAVRKFAREWERKPGRPPRQGAAPASRHRSSVPR